MKNRYWKILFWMSLISWITGATLFMARVNGGFLTNYLSDLAFPPWFYIYIRGLSTNDKQLPKLAFFNNWFGISPERAALSILFIGVVTEVKTLYWPVGIIPGTFDLADIYSYCLGLLLCYYLDKRQQRKTIKVTQAV
jgi:hypothetical protein